MSISKYILVIIVILNFIYSQDIAFVGNSTTRNQYPAYTKSHLYNYVIMNYAVTGSAVIRTNFEYKYKQEFVDAINRRAKYTVMLLGSCDWWVFSGNEDYWANEYRYLAKTLNNHSTVILGLIPYRIKEPISDQAFDKMNSIIRYISNELGTPLVDFNSLLGHDQNMYFNDGIHPNDAGQQRMASLLASLIIQLDRNTGDNTPPSVPQNFSATGVENYIQLQWDANTEDDMSLYFLFRGLIDGGPTTGLETLHYNYTSYIDTNVTPGTTYYYQIAAGDKVDNRSKKSDQISATAGNLSINKSLNDNQFWLTNKPNPFNPSTQILYSIPREANVKIEIFDIEGHHVRTLLDDHMNSGNNTIFWNGCDDNGCQVCSGVYFYTITTEDIVTTNKMTLLR